MHRFINTNNTNVISINTWGIQWVSGYGARFSSGGSWFESTHSITKMWWVELIKVKHLPNSVQC